VTICRDKYRNPCMEPSDGREPRDNCRRTPSRRYYGNGLPYAAIAGYPGKIILSKHRQASGRSTQIRLLREWLEVKGLRVVETGWHDGVDVSRRSTLRRRATAQQAHVRVLYATDLADRPRKADSFRTQGGFHRLADRYIFTALARAECAASDRAWLLDSTGSPSPHCLHLKLDVDTLVARAARPRLDYWESGMA